MQKLYGEASGPIKNNARADNIGRSPCGANKMSKFSWQKWFSKKKNAIKFKASMSASISGVSFYI